MKKVYLLLSGLTLSTLSFAQFRTGVMDEKPVTLHSKANELVSKTKATSVQKGGGDVLYSEDFNGSAGSWTTSGANDSLWLFDTDGPNGQFSSTTQIIQSPTAGNGFMIFDSDGYNTTTHGSKDDDYENVSGNLESPVYDMTGIAGATIQFYSQYRTCCSRTFYPKLQVSTDGFTTFVEYNASVDNVGVNDFSYSALTVVNVNSFLATASNKQNFQFRFVWSGADTYFWMIDDIEIVESNNYDLSFEKLWLANIKTANEHTSIPQSMAGVLTVQGVVRNLGISLPTNPQITVNIYDVSNTIVASEVGGSWDNNFTNEFDTVTFETTIDLSTLAIDEYFVEAVISMNETDDVNTNDSIGRTLYISDYYLGQQNYDVGYFIGSEGKGRSTNTNSVAMKIGNVMYVPNTTDLTGVELTFGRSSSFSTTAGEELEIEVFEVDYTQPFVSQSVTTGDLRFFTITSAMLPTSNGGKSAVLNFFQASGEQGAVTLTGGKYYMVAIGHNGGQNKHFAYTYNKGDEDGSSRLYIGSGATAARWYTIGYQSHTRMVFDPTASLDENNSVINKTNIYPNPTNGDTRVEFNLTNASSVSVKVMDITGKVVYTQNESNKAAGEHTIDINAASFRSGVYYVTISTDEAQVTKKLIRK